jgi:hypothetical protein
VKPDWSERVAIDVEAQEVSLRKNVHLHGDGCFSSCISRHENEDWRFRNGVVSGRGQSVVTSNDALTSRSALSVTLQNEENLIGRRSAQFHHGVDFYCTTMAIQILPQWPVLVGHFQLAITGTA